MSNETGTQLFGFVATARMHRQRTAYIRMALVECAGGNTTTRDGQTALNVPLGEATTSMYAMRLTSSNAELAAHTYDAVAASMHAMR